MYSFVSGFFHSDSFIMFVRVIMLLCDAIINSFPLLCSIPFYEYSVEIMLVAQSCPALCNPMDCSLRGSSIHGIFQARVLEWVAISFSRGSSQSRDGTWVFCLAGEFFTTDSSGKSLIMLMYKYSFTLVQQSRYTLNSFKGKVIPYLS